MQLLYVIQESPNVLLNRKETLDEHIKTCRPYTKSFSKVLNTEFVTSEGIGKPRICNSGSLGSRSRQHNNQKYRSGYILGLAPEVDKTITRTVDLKTFWASRQNNNRTIDLETSFLGSPEVDKTTARSIDLETLEIDKMITKSMDLETFWVWLQKFTNRYFRT